MPVSHAIQGKILRVFSKGNPSLDEVITGFKAAFTDPAVKPGMHLLVDLTESQANRSPEDLKEMVQKLVDKRWGLASRHAILVGHPLQHGLARVFSAHAEAKGSNIAVFSDRDEAEAWLLAEAEEA